MSNCFPLQAMDYQFPLFLAKGSLMPFDLIKPGTNSRNSRTNSEKQSLKLHFPETSFVTIMFVSCKIHSETHNHCEGQRIWGLLLSLDLCNCEV